MLHGSRGPLKSRFAKNLSSAGFASLVAQLIPAALAPVFTRLFSPAEIGLLSTFGACLGILSAASLLRIDWFASTAISTSQSDKLLSLGALQVVFASCVVGYLCSPFSIISPTILLNIDEFGRVQWMLPIALFFTGLLQLLLAVFIKNGHLYPLAQIRIVQAIVLAGLTLIAGVLHLGAVGLALGTTLSLGIALTAAAVTPEVQAALKRTQLDFSALLLEYRAIAGRLGPAGLSLLLDSLGLYIVPLLIATWFGIGEVGWYALATRIVSSPITAICTAFSQTFLAELGQSGGSPKLLSSIYNKSTWLLVVLCFPIIALGLGAPYYFGPVFGSLHWSGAGEVVVALLPMFCGSVIVGSTSAIVVALRLERHLLLWDLARILAIGAVFYYSHRLGMPFLDTIRVYAWTVGSLYFVLWFIVKLKLRKMA